MNVVVFGATGSIGREVLREATKQGHTVRAFSRSLPHDLPNHVDAMIGDLTNPVQVAAAIDGMEAAIFVHGASPVTPEQSEAVDYGAVRNVLAAAQGRNLRVVLMTLIGITNRDSSYNRSTHAPDWKRRAERILRASGHPYTIVRPGWFDYNGTDQFRITMLQGDTRRSGTPTDGGIARAQIARVLVAALSDESAIGKTLELVAETGAEQDSLHEDFAALLSDSIGAIDAAQDEPNMPLSGEPERVRNDLERLASAATQLRNVG